MEKQTMELYVHIPFCVRKCRYCDFLSFPASEERQSAYVDRLCEEIPEKASEEYLAGYKVSSVFLGGGTPSLLDAGSIMRILDTITENYEVCGDAEITIECNPGTLNREKLLCYRKNGINRISIGLQSADNEKLKLLGRIHTWEQFLHNYELVRECGFDNCNIDLMMALPGQSLKNYETNLHKVCSLHPEHISAYSLILEEGTPFYETYAKDQKKRERGEACMLLPEEETEREMYWQTADILKRYGYAQYEISNYAKKGYECRQNVGYWKRTPYLGFGLGASSLFMETRFQNTSELEKYLNGDFASYQVQKLTQKEQMEETMFLGLRLIEGVSRQEFAGKFGKKTEEVFGEAQERLKKERLLEEKGGRLCLTPKGIDLANYCMSFFLL
ncbi:MAG: oxygen-independent coproporphyrinogen III oxidase [Eubacterium sp.]|nr:oxygen-independent coproporphyrinogen III oxidase [Eubacterium sp.]